MKHKGSATLVRHVVLDDATASDSNHHCNRRMHLEYKPKVREIAVIGAQLGKVGVHCWVQVLQVFHAQLITQQLSASREGRSDQHVPN